MSGSNTHSTGPHLVRPHPVRPHPVRRGEVRLLCQGPEYSVSLSTDADDLDAVQRLRYRVFATEPGFSRAMSEVTDERDADIFDDYCDQLVVRERATGEVVGCYRMLPPPGAIAAGGLYTATEFDLHEFDAIAPQMVEMGRACVAAEHRSGSVMALMWAGILSYMDATDYRFLVGCSSVPIRCDDDAVDGQHVRGIRDVVRERHRGSWTAYPYRKVVLDGVALDDIVPPAKVKMPPLLRGYLRLGGVICGEPSHDPDFGVADFVTLVDRTTANRRYLDRLRSAAESAAL